MKLSEVISCLSYFIWTNLFRILIRKANEMHYFSTLFDKEPTCFREIYCLSSGVFNTLFTATGICHTSYVDCLLTRSSWPRLQTINITSTTNTRCCEYSIKTPDDKTVNLSEKCRVLYQVTLRNSASRWLLLWECITMHVPLNVKLIYFIQHIEMIILLILCIKYLFG